MNESFAELFEESLKELDMQPGSVVTGTVVAVDGDFVVVNAGLKSEGVIPRGQFLDDEGNLSIGVGDQVKVALVSLEDGSGETQLSREKAKRAEAWEVLEKAIENDEIITGRITGKVRGGFTVDVNSSRVITVPLLTANFISHQTTQPTGRLCHQQASLSSEPRH